ncbi:hypothetical protein MMC30_004745 [Trapelia coarctata]|nr:hypothetical protein [Trapelia coarctata]
MEQEAVCQPGTYNALAEVTKDVHAVLLMVNNLQGDIISRKDIGEPESEQKSSTAPQTPHKIPCRLDYSTPRVRYGGQSTLPLTPDYTPSKSSKREFKYALEDLSFYPQPAKRRHTDPQRSTPRSLLRQGSLLKISKMHHPETPEQVPFSADEMKRTCEAVLSQIDWNDVQEYVASNRSTASYKKAMKSVLQAEVSKLFQEEDNSDNGSTD